MRLAVNIDHVATIREARRATEPEPVAAALLAELAGADGITVHLRGDRRHIKERDVELLREVVATKLNVEMAATQEMVQIAARLRPNQVTLVPEQPNELTTQGGLDVVANAEGVRAAVEQLHESGIYVSVFLDADTEHVRCAKLSRADAVEINTGSYAEAKRTDREKHLALIVKAARFAASEGLEVLGGHGLTYVNIRPIAAVSEIVELNIGHSIVARAALVGMERAVREMIALLRQ